MFGQHLLKHWARTQSGIALSSGEAELYGMIKGATETLGMQSLLQELGKEGIEGTLLTDSSAAKGCATRQGAGRMKHVQLNAWWLQEQTASGRLKINEIPREQNVADLFTHHWDNTSGERTLAMMGQINLSQ